MVFPNEFRPASITALFNCADTPAKYFIPMGFGDEINLRGNVDLFFGKNEA